MTDLLTLQDVAAKSQSLHADSGEVCDICSEKWLKVKLRERYGEHIQFNELRGRRNVICCRYIASYIINQKWQESN